MRSPKWLGPACGGMLQKRPEPLQKPRKRLRPSIQDLASHLKRLFSKISAPIHHVPTGQVRLASISQSRKAEIVSAIDEKDAPISNIGSRDSFSNEGDTHLSFKEHRLSGAKHPGYSIHPLHCRLTLPSASWLMLCTEGFKLGRGRNANRIEEQHAQSRKV